MEISSELESVVKDALTRTKDRTEEDRRWSAWEAGMNWIIDNNIPNGPALQQLLRDRVAQMIAEEKAQKNSEMTWCPYCHQHHPTAVLAMGWKCPQTPVQYDPNLLTS